MPAQSKPLRFSLFGLLYFTQGTILGYFSALNALYLLQNGLDMADVGIFSSIALIPFMIKILFGFISDRYNFLGLGHRKPYILLGLLVQFICLILVAGIHPGTQYWLFVGIAFLLQLGMAFYDTCTDGLALDITSENEKGLLQGFMVGGRSVGVIVASLAAGIIAEQSWPMVFYFLAALTFIPIPLLFFIHESKKAEGERFNWAAFKSFKEVSVLAAAGAGLIIFLVIVGANQLMNPFLTDRFGISLRTAGMVTTLWGVGCVAGAFAGGMIKDKAGDKISIWVSLVGVAIAMIFLAAAPSFPLAIAAAIYFGLAYGAAQSIYFAIAMKYAMPGVAASMYAILMAVTNVGQGIGLGVGGAVSKNFGFPVALIGLGVIIFLVVPLLPWMFRSTRQTT